MKATAVENVGGGRDFIDINGKSLHVISYLNNFLFESVRLRTPVGNLSGGEQNRLILAKLFSQPANLLVLDEPTNDLDLETLELLEELLGDFDGTILLVSHDRSFVDNVVTSTLVFEGDGHISEHVGGYSDWQRELARNAAKNAEKKPATVKQESQTAPAPAKKQASKLSYKLQRELDELPGRIEQLDAEIAALTAQTQAAGFFAQERSATEAVLQLIAEKQQALDACYLRWETLENS
jgi:ATP-binding cassette subfamily F protein uup